MSYADLNFKVPHEFREKYRLAATLSKKSGVDILHESFAIWLAVHDTDGRIREIHAEMTEREKSRPH